MFLQIQHCVTTRDIVVENLSENNLLCTISVIMNIKAQKNFTKWKHIFIEKENVITLKYKSSFFNYLRKT